MTAASASSPADDPAARNVKSASAIYVGNLLGACAEIDVTYKTMDTATKKRSQFQAKADERKAASAKDQKKDDKPVDLPDSCEVTFADRKPLATCVSPMKPSNIIESGNGIENFYIVEMLRGDKTQRECIEKSGKWTSLARDSEEYMKAEAEADLRKSEAEMKRLRGEN